MDGSRSRIDQTSGPLCGGREETDLLENTEEAGALSGEELQWELSETLRQDSWHRAVEWLPWSSGSAWPFGARENRASSFGPALSSTIAHFSLGCGRGLGRRG